VIPTYTDLVPALTLVPTEANANRPSRVEWTVQNNGTLATDATSWVDQVYLSSTPSLGANPLLLGSVSHVGVVGVGGSYVGGLDFTMPRDVTGSYYVIVKTDAFGNTYESGNTDNNTVVAGTATTILPEPKPNLVISAINAPSTWLVGTTVPVSYSVSNIGNDVANSLMYEHLQLVNVADPSKIISLNSGAVVRSIAPDASFTNQVNIAVPSGSEPTGAWQLQMVADAGGRVSESNENDNSASIPITLASPDLAVDTLTTSGTWQGGETLTLNWITRNSGNADAANVRDVVYLSRDGVIGSDDLKLGEVSHDAIAAGDGIASQLSFQLPIDASGAYRLIVKTDPNNQINENGSEGNNQADLGVSVAQDTYADLAVTSIDAPQQVINDPASLTVSYSVTNQGTGIGRTLAWTDVVVYSADEVLGNGDDIVLGTVAHTGGVAVNDSYTGTVTYQLTPNFSRHGHVFVRTDTAGKVWQNGQTANDVMESATPTDVMPNRY
jgi:hypothetical protein